MDTNTGRIGNYTLAFGYVLLVLTLLVQDSRHITTTKYT